jgi:hypothetical protein
MTKFVISKTVPEVLSNYEMRIDPPNLLQEVNNCWGHRPANGHTGINWLRQIASEVSKWDSRFNNYRHTIPNDYAGIPYSTPEEVADIVLRMINDRYPKLCDSWVEHCVRHKPPFTKLIWFTGDFKQSSTFTSNFIDRIELDEVDEWLGRHKAKSSVNTEKTSVETSSPAPKKVNLDSKKSTAKDATVSTTKKQEASPTTDLDAFIAAEDL